MARSAASPILHVNGDDPEAVVKAAKMAMRFRQRFGADTVLDMLCFRRYGHNEGDEPMFTQPHMYKVIADKVARNDVVVEKYKKKLVSEGVVDAAGIAEMEHRVGAIMSDNYEMSGNRADVESELKADWMGANWSNISTETPKSTSTCLTHRLRPFTTCLTHIMSIYSFLEILAFYVGVLHITANTNFVSRSVASGDNDFNLMFCQSTQQHMVDSQIRTAVSEVFLKCL